MSMIASPEDRKWVLESLPQKPPFLFLDEILELSPTHIVARKRFSPDEYFYRGHFPGDPITPGVILVETMAQAGLVALGIYLVKDQGPLDPVRTLFSECAIEFLDVVRPDETVMVYGERVFWRKNKLHSRVELKKENGVIAATGTVSGIGVNVPAQVKS